MDKQASEIASQLALHGGTPALESWPKRPPRWGAEELERLTAMVEQPSLFYWNGPQTTAMVDKFKERYSFRYIMPCSSGTASIHIALAAAGIGPGDEVIVPPVSDMGTYIGILYQQGVPVFADVEPYSANLSVAEAEKKITPRTKAIIPVHLAGNPCDLDGFRELAERHSLVIIEDCAQAWGAESRGRAVGTVGDIACYSLNDFKHIGCGDGGIVATNNEQFGPLLQSFGDKGYDRISRTRNPQILGLNYRMSEPEAAVATAQLDRLAGIAENRNRIGRRLDAILTDTPGVFPPKVEADDFSTYWFYMFRIDPSVLECDHKEFARALEAEGVPAKAGYLEMPAYQYTVFQDRVFFNGRWPILELGLTDMDYRKVSCPVAEEILKTGVVFPVFEGMEDDFVEQLGQAIRKVAEHYAK